MEKSVFVSDSVHGTIPLTQFEKAVISTQVFNRLHNVLQNSTVYLTYPTNRTSRFAHSLGVMHLAGEIYYRGALNADTLTQKTFLDLLVEEVRLIPRSPPFEDGVLPGFDKIHGTISLEAPLITSDMDLVYQDHLPNLPGESIHRRVFLIGFQAIRLAGLLHDLGHPPFSHVSELALGEIYSDLDMRRESGDLTEREVNFLSILDPVKKKDEKDKKDRPPIHVGIGLLLARTLLSRAYGDQVAKYPGDEKRAYFLALGTYLAQRILSNETDFTTALHSIVASDFDADRLDFVARDSVASGISAEPFRYDRLRNVLRLVFPRRDDGETIIPTPRFLPSVRSLADLERFFRLYQDLYRYVVFHHRVVRTDGLMKESILDLAKEYLGVKEPDPVQASPLDIPNDISGLWIALDGKNKATPRDFVDHYIQWDDPWLITRLRRAYFKAVDAREEGSAWPSSLEMRLEEVLSNHRNFQSLYKGVEGFIEVDESFVESLPSDFRIDRFLSRGELSEAGVPKFCALVQEFLDLHRENQIQQSKLRQDRGFFLSLIRVLLLRANRIFMSEQLRFVKAAVDKLVRVHESPELLDGFVVSKVLKTGVTESFQLHNEGRIVKLPTVSRLANDLSINANHIPPFFTYICGYQVLSDKELSGLRKALGENLAEQFLREKV